MQSHTPPVMPSPARLAVTSSASASASSHSPSLPQNPNPNLNPNPSRPPPSSSSFSISSSTMTTSSTLLSLLPPLPRAQSLLLQMASLAAKLFDASPSRPVWLASYRGSLPSFLPSNAPPLPSPPPSPSPSTAKEVLAHFTSLQTQLFEAVAELQEILDLADARLRLARDAQALDVALLAFARKLREAQHSLDLLLDDYADYRADHKRRRPGSGPDTGSHPSLRSSLDLDEVLAYAHRISYTTFAPPEHGAGLAPLRGALPPAPQDNEMRASQLYHFADLDVGMPKKAPEVKEGAGTPEALAQPLMESTPPKEEAAPPVPISLPITVPPGWRKGMPVELPSELPPPPPGWKPGDPIQLPLDGVVVGGKGEEQRVAGVPGVPALPPKAPEPIQVKYVQLDINPDQDDYSSDYSSEEGSSEEDDED